ncbi:MAG TPA: ABC-F family ATP-binding cassette domain-containing protein [Bryobacteraceae bacterium]|nr:ABC-F family ATP-binding cassette domain-containing protein [Bryobacteraceae bacterium]
MSLLQVSELAFSYPTTGLLFSACSFSVNPGDRLAIVGPNGAGKSTLLRLLTGELEPTEGEIVRRKVVQIAHVLQEQSEASDEALFDFVFGSRPELAALRDRLQAYESGAHHAASDDEYAALVNDYQASGGYAAEADVERILDGLGFAASERGLTIGRLSGGQRTRAALARALNSEADLLLLDEPTNHLDIAAREWLENELSASVRACVAVSHDRMLLRHFANRVVEIARGRVNVFEQGYEDYRATRALRERQAWQNYEGYQRRKAAAESAARQRAQLSVKVATTPAGTKSGHDFYLRKAAKVARTGRILRERITREPQVAKPWEEEPIPLLDFSGVRRSGDVVASIENLAKEFGGKRLFADLSFYVARGERLAILGPNGSGKTTLLRILLGLEIADSGGVRLGANVVAGYFSQDTDDLRRDVTAVELCGGSTLPRTLMGCLKLRPDRVNEPIGYLSPGERSKVALVRLLVSGANLLLLDEPTNHLEIEAQEALEQTLAQFPGALIVVSHDRSFLEAFGEDLKTVELGEFKAVASTPPFATR